jgi:hypothetical protein
MSLGTLLLLGIGLIVGYGVYYVTNLTYELKERIRRDRTIRDAQYRVLEDEEHEKLETKHDA